MRDRDYCGYTLAEVLAVLAIISLLAVSLPALVLRDSPGRDVRHATDVVMGELKSLRAESRRKGETTIFSVSTSSEIPENVEVFVEGAESTETIRFFAGGGSSGGRVEVRRGNLRQILDVDWMTGRIRQSGEAAS